MPNQNWEETIKRSLEFVWNSSPHNKDKNIEIATKELLDLFKPKPVNWEEIEKEFDEEFTGRGGYLNEHYSVKIKQFLQQKLQQNKEYYEGVVREMIGEYCNNEKAKDFYCYNAEGNIRMQDGWNLKRDEIIEVAKKHNLYKLSK